MRESLFIYFILHLGITNAQNLEITVLDSNFQPVPYAYVLINGVAFEVTDTLGKAKVPIRNLVINDTISIGYLGAAPAQIIFDEALRESKNHCFILDESSYNLDEVIVTYQNIEKLFKRNCDYVPQLNYNCTLKSNFNGVINLRNQPNNRVSGQLEAVNEVFSNEFKPYQNGWFHHPIKFKTEDDTINISTLLSFHSHLALDMINRFIGLSQYQLSNNPRFRPIFNYLGEKDGFKVFRLSYRNSADGGCAQIILNIDKKTKNISSAEIDVVNPKTKGNYLNSYNIKFDCRVFTHKKPMRNPVYLPENIRYIFKYGDFLQADLRISDISINYRKP